jgi:hypothetical protein
MNDNDPTSPVVTPVALVSCALYCSEARLESHRFVGRTPQLSSSACTAAALMVKLRA